MKIRTLSTGKIAFKSILPSFGLAAVLSLGLSAQAEGEKEFPSPQAAVDDLKSAVEKGDTNELHAIFGPFSHSLVAVDVVEANAERQMFRDRVKKKVTVASATDSKTTLELGEDNWPFPIPIVKKNEGHWAFDTEAGAEEILNRRIGANEVGAIRVCRAYVQAQREYVTVDRNHDKILEYAKNLRSTPGTHDGLYWSTRTGDELSPLGPLVGAAHEEGYRENNRILAGDQSPYHGYYFKILDRQGKSAVGGPYRYIINGHMIAGFALLAWPAEWGNTGVMTFIVNQQGDIYQKNLGPKTAAKARSLNTYNPDSSWTLTKDE